MSSMTGSLGQFGEAWARGYLVRNGYEILASNVHYRVGEIDIVARDLTDLVFVEVKCRRSSDYGSPAEAVTAHKYERISRAIGVYLQEHELDDEPHRLDVIALELDGRGAVGRVTHLKGVERPG
jgi:putative endonuclease